MVPQILTQCVGQKEFNNENFPLRKSDDISESLTLYSYHVTFLVAFIRADQPTSIPFVIPDFETRPLKFPFWRGPYFCFPVIFSKPKRSSAVENVNPIAHSGN